MNISLNKNKTTLSYRLLCGFIAFSFMATMIVPPAQAQTILSGLNLPAPGAMVTTTPGYIPPLIKGITVHPENPLMFDFIVDSGEDYLDGQELKEEANKLIKYFLASLTVPEDEMWVNLSPYEKERIIPDSFGVTEMGRDLLAQDYLLKQLTASLMYPEDELGSEFWTKVYEKAYTMYGTTKIPLNTFNKVWIVPEKAVIYEEGNSAYVVDSKLKVMLEEDYVALQKNMERGTENVEIEHGTLNREHSSESKSQVPSSKFDDEVIIGVQSEVIREVLIPAIEEEVNHGETFANLRQIYNSMILAMWYKENLRESLLGQVYVNQNKVKGIDIQDKNAKQKIYQQYLEAFSKGVYNYIKEDIDPATNEMIPRKYFSGGVTGFSMEDYLDAREIVRDLGVIPQEFYTNTYASSEFTVRLAETEDEETYWLDAAGEDTDPAVDYEDSLSNSSSPVMALDRIKQITDNPTWSHNIIQAANKLKNAIQAGRYGEVSRANLASWFYAFLQGVPLSVIESQIADKGDYRDSHKLGEQVEGLLKTVLEDPYGNRSVWNARKELSEAIIVYISHELGWKQEIVTDFDEFNAQPSRNNLRYLPKGARRRGYVYGTSAQSNKPKAKVLHFGAAKKSSSPVTAADRIKQITDNATWSNRIIMAANELREAIRTEHREVTREDMEAWLRDLRLGIHPRTIWHRIQDDFNTRNPHFLGARVYNLFVNLIGDAEGAAVERDVIAQLGEAAIEYVGNGLGWTKTEAKTSKKSEKVVSLPVSNQKRPQVDGFDQVLPGQERAKVLPLKSKRSSSPLENKELIYVGENTGLIHVVQYVAIDRSTTVSLYEGDPNREPSTWRMADYYRIKGDTVRLFESFNITAHFMDGKPFSLPFADMFGVDSSVEPDIQGLPSEYVYESAAGGHIKVKYDPLISFTAAYTEKENKPGEWEEEPFTWYQGNIILIFQVIHELIDEQRLVDLSELYFELPSPKLSDFTADSYYEEGTGTGNNIIPQSPPRSSSPVFKQRASGVLAPFTSLPSRFGNGDFGPDAYRFIEFLKETNQKYWQFLPLNPNLYMSPSAFALDLLLMSPEKLIEYGWLNEEDIGNLPEFNDEQVDYTLVNEFKKTILSKAFKRFENDINAQREYEQFLEDNRDWVEDYALFKVLSEYYQGKPWYEWEDEYKLRDSQALVRLRRQFADEINKYIFEQYALGKQWDDLKVRAHQNGIQLVGDMPIYVARNSVDVWVNPEMFKLDEKLNPTVVAGVPPDYFSKTGQLWGNPVYDWKAHKEDGFSWWKARFRRNFSLYDAVRVDHFRGLIAYWEVPADHDTALNGEWNYGVPVYEFFDAMVEEFGELPIIAEDLGEITPDVYEVMDDYGFPGMRVLQFAFGDSDKEEEWRQNLHLPHNYNENVIVYTGTHDNNTTKGWLQSEADQLVKNNLAGYLDVDEVHEDSVADQLVELAMNSKANTVIVPMQDLLGLGAEARMNTPGTTKRNWLWRFTWDQLTQDVKEKQKDITASSDRLASSPIDIPHIVREKADALKRQIDIDSENKEKIVRWFTIFRTEMSNANGGDGFDRQFSSNDMRDSLNDVRNAIRREETDSKKRKELIDAVLAYVLGYDESINVQQLEEEAQERILTSLIEKHGSDIETAAKDLGTNIAKIISLYKQYAQQQYAQRWEEDAKVMQDALKEALQKNFLLTSGRLKDSQNRDDDVIVSLVNEFEGWLTAMIKLVSKENIKTKNKFIKGMEIFLLLLEGSSTAGIVEKKNKKSMVINALVRPFKSAVSWWKIEAIDFRSEQTASLPARIRELGGIHLSRELSEYLARAFVVGIDGAGIKKHYGDSWKEITKLREDSKDDSEKEEENYIPIDNAVKRMDEYINALVSNGETVLEKINQYVRFLNAVEGSALIVARQKGITKPVLKRTLWGLRNLDELALVNIHHAQSTLNSQYEVFKEELARSKRMSTSELEESLTDLLYAVMVFKNTLYDRQFNGNSTRRIDELRGDISAHKERYDAVASSPIDIPDNMRKKAEFVKAAVDNGREKKERIRKWLLDFKNAEESDWSVTSQHFDKTAFGKLQEIRAEIRRIANGNAQQKGALIDAIIKYIIGSEEDSAIIPLAQIENKSLNQKREKAQALIAEFKTDIPAMAEKEEKPINFVQNFIQDYGFKPYRKAWLHVTQQTIEDVAKDLRKVLDQDISDFNRVHFMGNTIQNSLVGELAEEFLNWIWKIRDIMAKDHIKGMYNFLLGMEMMKIRLDQHDPQETIRLSESIVNNKIKPIRQSMLWSDRSAKPKFYPAMSTVVINSIRAAGKKHLSEEFADYLYSATTASPGSMVSLLNKIRINRPSSIRPTSADTKSSKVKPEPAKTQSLEDIFANMVPAGKGSKKSSSPVSATGLADVNDDLIEFLVKNILDYSGGTLKALMEELNKNLKEGGLLNPLQEEGSNAGKIYDSLPFQVSLGRKTPERVDNFSRRGVMKFGDNAPAYDYYDSLVRVILIEESSEGMALLRSPENQQKILDFITTFQEAPKAKTVIFPMFSKADREHLDEIKEYIEEIIQRFPLRTDSLSVAELIEILENDLKKEKLVNLSMGDLGDSYNENGLPENVIQLLEEAAWDSFDYVRNQPLKEYLRVNYAELLFAVLFEMEMENIKAKRTSQKMQMYVNALRREYGVSSSPIINKRNKIVHDVAKILAARVAERIEYDTLWDRFNSEISGGENKVDKSDFNFALDTLEKQEVIKRHGIIISVVDTRDVLSSLAFGADISITGSDDVDRESPADNIFIFDKNFKETRSIAMKPSDWVNEDDRDTFVTLMQDIQRAFKEFDVDENLATALKEAIEPFRSKLGVTHRDILETGLVVHELIGRASEILIRWNRANFESQSSKGHLEYIISEEIGREYDAFKNPPVAFQLDRALKDISLVYDGKADEYSLTANHFELYVEPANSDQPNEMRIAVSLEVLNFQQDWQDFDDGKIIIAMIDPAAGEVLDTQTMGQNYSAVLTGRKGQSVVLALVDGYQRTYRLIDETAAASSPIDFNAGLAPATVTSSVGNGQGADTSVGGIDLNPALLDLQIKRDGNGVPLPVWDQPIETMHIEGFLPVIIHVTPIPSLPIYLGFGDIPEEEERRTPTSISYLSPADRKARLEIEIGT